MKFRRNIKPRLEEARNSVIEKLAEFDDEIMEIYFLEDKEVPAEMLKKAGRNATLKLLITPVFAALLTKTKAFSCLLDAVIDYLPSPIDVGAVVGMDIDDPEKTHTRHPSAKDPFSALAFKLIHDPFVGQQTFIRIFSGCAEKRHADPEFNQRQT